MNLYDTRQSRSVGQRGRFRLLRMLAIDQRGMTCAYDLQRNQAPFRVLDFIFSLHFFSLWLGLLSYQQWHVCQSISYVYWQVVTSTEWWRKQHHVRLILTIVWHLSWRKVCWCYETMVYIGKVLFCQRCHGMLQYKWHCWQGVYGWNKLRMSRRLMLMDKIMP